MNKRIDLIGQRFGKLVVQSYSHNGPGGAHWTCRCDCGTVKVVAAGNLKSGRQVSCGCHKDQGTRERSTTHAMSKHPGYQSWKAMMNRCYSDKHDFWSLYGARGIVVCDAWHDFANFWADMGPSWLKGLTLDRRDPDGNYEPANCRWATRLEQANNRRNNRIIETPRGPMTLMEASRTYGIGQKTLAERIDSGRHSKEVFAPPRTLSRRRLHSTLTK